MGWKRINGREYYYRCERVEGRVETTYLGAGELGRLSEILDAELRAEREAEREAVRVEWEEAAAEERAVSAWFDGVQAVADAAMLAAGFYKHKGQWRRRGDERVQERERGGRGRDETAGPGPRDPGVAPEGLQGR